MNGAIRHAALVLLLLLFGCVDRPRAAAPSSVAESRGRLVSYEAFPSHHVAARKVVVWLPPDYDQNPQQRYAVLYMQDGQNLFAPPEPPANAAWDVDRHLLALRAQGKVRPTIVVGIWNTRANRAREYAPADAINTLPVAIRNLVIKQGADGDRSLLGDDYLHFLVEELKPFIDSHYRTRPDRDDTVLMGSSMGGVISLYALASYPAVFGGAACLSTHWLVTTDFDLIEPKLDPRVDAIAAAFRDWLNQHLPRAGAHRLYFDHGTRNLDAHYAAYQERIDALLEAHGYRLGHDWVSAVYPGGDHNERAWNARLDTPLQFLLAPDAASARSP